MDLVPLNREPELKSIEFLDKEIFTDVTLGAVHEVDLIAKVRLRGETSFFLIHTEAQTRKEHAFARRFFHYFARLHERYGLPIYPVVVFSFDSPKTAEHSRYDVRLLDLDVLRFEYRVVQLNQLNWRSFLRNENPVAAALMSKMRIAPKDRPVVKLECLRMIFALKLDPARTRLLSGFVDSYLLLNEAEEGVYRKRLAQQESFEREGIMEIETSWMRQGREQDRAEGLAEGLAEGRTEGRQNEALVILTRLLRKRLGELEPALLEQVSQLPVDELEDLSEALLSFKSVTELVDWLSKPKAE